MSRAEAKRFGEKLRSLRTRQGLTLKQLASLLGQTSHGYISELETGRKRPTVEVALLTAAIFDVTTDMLLKDEVVLQPISRIEPIGGTMSSLINGQLTPLAFERLRLLLSTYQDGSGHERAADGTTFPGFRQFERSLALALGGTAPENKRVFDVLVSAASPDAGPQYGISCKMRGELDKTANAGYVYIEVSNARKQFIMYLAQIGINTETDYRVRPMDTGKRILEWIAELHRLEQKERKVILEQSSYLVLLYNANAEFQLFQYPVNLYLDNASFLEWIVPRYTNKGIETYREHLRAIENGTMRVQWFWNAGHLKFFPSVNDALWKSDRFRLEPLPAVETGILNKVRQYFPEQWAQVSGEGAE